MFFVDGLDVLFRIAFSILKESEQELLGCQSISAVYIALESIPTRMWEADRLLQVSLSGKSRRIYLLIVANSQRLIFAALWCILTSLSDATHMSRPCASYYDTFAIAIENLFFFAKTLASLHIAPLYRLYILYPRLCSNIVLSLSELVMFVNVWHIR